MENNIYFKPYDIKKIRHLERKQWFELNDLRELFPNTKLFIVKGRKNIGKTYALINEMIRLAKLGKNLS